MSHLNGKNVVITGGTKGIGFATAEHFKSCGASVLITGSSDQSVETALAQLPGVQGVKCDLTDMQDVFQLKERVSQTLPSVDVLFANAGIAHFRPVEEMTEELFDEMMAVNVKGLYFSIQQIVPMMPQGSTIVITASIAPRKGQVGLAGYGASKGAARGMARNLAAELMDRGIRVNCLSPGPVATEIFSRSTGGDPEKSKEMLDFIASTVPVGRVGTSKEMALAVEFMCGPGAAYMQGSELTLDGGKAEL